MYDYLNRTFSVFGHQFGFKDYFERLYLKRSVRLNCLNYPLWQSHVSTPSLELSKHTSCTSCFWSPVDVVRSFRSQMSLFPAAFTKVCVNIFLRSISKIDDYKMVSAVTSLTVRLHFHTVRGCVQTPPISLFVTSLTVTVSIYYNILYIGILSLYII